jgi:RNA polymerase sigma-70 factor (ECF subfamily)
MDNPKQLTTDEELAHLSLKHTWAFALLIDRYEAKLRRYVSRLGRFSIEDVEDLLQDIFMKVYKNLNGFDSSLKFSSWIYRIAHNEVVSFFRKNHIRPEGHSAQLTDELLQTLASEIDVLKNIEREDSRRLLASSINMLDSKYKDVIVLKFFEDKSYEEISNILMIPRGTVAIRLKRAKDQILNIMNKQGYIYE